MILIDRLRKRWISVAGAAALIALSLLVTLLVGKTVSFAGDVAPKIKAAAVFPENKQTMWLRMNDPKFLCNSLIPGCREGKKKRGGVYRFKGSFVPDSMARAVTNLRAPQEDEIRITVLESEWGSWYRAQVEQPGVWSCRVTAEVKERAGGKSKLKITFDNCEGLSAPAIRELRKQTNEQLRATAADEVTADSFAQVELDLDRINQAGKTQITLVEASAGGQADPLPEPSPDTPSPDSPSPDSPSPDSPSPDSPSPDDPSPNVSGAPGGVSGAEAVLTPQVDQPVLNGRMTVYVNGKKTKRIAIHNSQAKGKIDRPERGAKVVVLVEGKFSNGISVYRAVKV